MKGKGGFVGITGNEHALEKFFIIAPSLSRIVEEFKDYSGIESRQASSLHHERVGGKSSKMIMNASRFVDAVTKQENPLKQRNMFNLVTFAVTPAEVSQNIESRDHLGNEALEKFVSTRMVDKTVNFWDPQKKNNFTCYKDVGAVSKSTINGQLVTIKQERNLLSRLLVVAKSRPEYSVKDAIGEYEFNTTPQSNFHPDSSMIMLSGKSSAAQLIMDLPSTTTISESTPEGSSTAPKVLIIDAMCVVNMVKKTSTEKFTAALFASEFLIKITKLSRPYDEVRIVFDQYIHKSLKESTRNKRTKKAGPCIHYHVNDDTEIRNVKAFLSHIDTKDELTSYLAQTVRHYYKGNPKKVLVMYTVELQSKPTMISVMWSQCQK